MKAKDLLLIGSGLAIGYLVFKKDLFKKKATIGSGVSDVVSGAGEIVSGGVNAVTTTVTELVNPKQAECDKKWNDYAIGARFSSEEGMQKAKSEFMTSCLSSK